MLFDNGNRTPGRSGRSLPLDLRHERWVGTAQAAELLGISDQMLRVLRDRGDIRSFHIGRATRYRVSELNAYLDRTRRQ